MSPTVFQWEGYRFFFLSREEERMDVHVRREDGEAKFWLEPEVDLAQNCGLSPGQISETLECVRERKDEISEAWDKHFKG